MSRRALGLIETYGYVAAVEALDSALKAANVQLIGCEMVKGGIVTIEIGGDVGSVKASVDAAATAAGRIGRVLSTHVIPRPSGEVEKILPNEFKKAEGDRTEMKTEDEPQSAPQINMYNEQTTPASNIYSEQIPEAVNVDDEKAQPDETEKIIEPLESEIKTREELKGMKTVELRNLARHLNGISIDRKDIKFSKKQELIDAILESYKKL